MGTKRYQGGSILTFVLVAVVVAALLVGSVIWLRQRGEAARQQSTPGEVSREVPPQQEPQKEDKKDTPNKESTTNRDTSKDTAVQPSQLPETGPTEVIVSIITIAAVVYTATRYMVSRSELVRAFAATSSL